MNDIHHTTKRRTWPYLVTAVLITGIAIRVFFIDSFTVVGNSMAPTITDGDYVFVNKWSYNTHTPQQGDIVVGNFRGMEGKNVVKRIAAVPGQWITIEEGHIYVATERNGERIKVGELDKERDIVGAMSTSTYTYRLDPYEYFVLGDNGMGSVDSRTLGPVDEYHISGRVFSAFRQSEVTFKIFE